MIAGYTPDTFYGCSNPYYTTSTITGDNICRCSICGQWHGRPDTTQVICIPLQPPEPEEDDREWLRQWHRAVSRQAAWEAQIALRSAGDDPRGKVPLQAQKVAYVRPRAKKRVCAGSSRYRVLVF